MRLSAEDLGQIKAMFDASVMELVERKDFCEKIAKLVNVEIKTLKESVSQLERENQLLRQKLDDTEQHSRRSSLRVFGISEEPNENTENCVINVFKEKMGVTIKPEAVDRCHRIGRKNDVNKGPRPILVKFVSYRSRQEVYNMKKRLKGTRIVVSEDLTSHNYNLLKSAKDRCGKQRAWSNDGRVFISHNGSTILIKSLSELDAILHQ